MVVAEHRMTPDPDPAPTMADVAQAREVEREVAEQTYRVAADRLPRQVRGVARVEAERVARRIGAIGAVLAVLASVAIAVAAYSTATSAQTAAAGAQRTVDTALEQLAQANDTLQQRGQAPVPTPEQAADPSEAITAAVLAQVLASLPPQPSVEQVADGLRGAVISALTGTTLQAVTAEAERYFQLNPPRISASELQAAVDRAIAANPPRDGIDGESPPCLSTPAQCQGADGTDGADGVDGEPGRSVTAGPQPVRLDDGSCVWRVEYSAPPLVEEFPAGDASCPGVFGLGARNR